MDINLSNNSISILKCNNLFNILIISSSSILKCNSNNRDGHISKYHNRLSSKDLTQDLFNNSLNLNKISCKGIKTQQIS